MHLVYPPAAGVNFTSVNNIHGLGLSVVVSL